ncbi:hypothetical protein [Streptomyces sp. CT34]|uniref:hypothetical protein n=1 Tax=Streptomyces sp. CT34 TaxID=1553907 RepID=UPI0012FE88F8|nr:hypothetical protein [Streptomyces sp. CT34]
MPALVGAVFAVALLGGCGFSAGLRNAGPAPSVSVPASPSPLWPGYTPTPGSGNGFVYTPPVRPPLPGITVPPGGLKKISPVALLTADPDVGGELGKSLRNCPGSSCPLRPPVYPDLTGDGRPAVVLVIDDHGFADLHVYVATSGNSVRQVLSYSANGVVDAGTVGHDLVIKSSGDHQDVTRYHWNGKIMVPVPIDSPSAVRTP